MRLPIFLSSTVLIATAILGTNSSVYAQCQGGYCPIPNAYFDQNAPSKYGYNNPNTQGNQNPNWQGNQNPDWRNDNGWRGNNNQSYYQGSNNTYYRNNANNNDSNASWNTNTSNSNFSRQGSNPSTYSSSNGRSYYYNNVSDATSDQNTTTDKLLQQKIDDALKNNYLKKNYKEVNVRVYNGNVTLSGTVNTEQDRQDVESRVRGLGVNSVNDQLQVTSTAQADSNGSNYNDQTVDSDTSNVADKGTVSDQDIQSQADDTLKNNYVKKNYDTVVVTVSNGIVTISGIVDSDKDRQDIRERLQKIKGIRNISDRLQVSEGKTSYNYYKKPAYSR